MGLDAITLDAINAVASEVVLVRHGETVENVDETLQGQHPRRGRLTARGLAQASAVGRALVGERFDRVYCSPLERAVLTLGRILEARVAAGVRPMPLRFVDALREMDVGDLHGRSRADWLAAADAHGNRLRFRPPGGESLHDLQVRVGAWYEHVVRRRGGRVLVVAHGGVVRAMLTHALGQPMSMAWAGVGEPFETRNASIARLGLVGGTVVAATVDDTRHLAGLVAGAGAGGFWDAEAARFRPWREGQMGA